MFPNKAANGYSLQRPQYFRQLTICAVKQMFSTPLHCKPISSVPSVSSHTSTLTRVVTGSGVDGAVTGSAVNEAVTGSVVDGAVTGSAVDGAVTGSWVLTACGGAV